jgi:hypothetical protein
MQLKPIPPMAENRTFTTLSTRAGVYKPTLSEIIDVRDWIVIRKIRNGFSKRSRANENPGP